MTRIVLRLGPNLFKEPNYVVFRDIYYFRQSFVKTQSTIIPESKVELTQFKVKIKAGLVQLEEREIHVTVTLNSAQKQILRIEDEVFFF